MTHTLTRRGFIAASAAIAASTALPRMAFGQSVPLTLTATSAFWISTGARPRFTGWSMALVDRG